MYNYAFKVGGVLDTVQSGFPFYEKWLLKLYNRARLYNIWLCGLYNIIIYIALCGYQYRIIYPALLYIIAIIIHFRNLYSI